MNYMSEVAKMLGVKLGEEFHISTNGNTEYVLTVNGLFPAHGSVVCNNTLNELLTGSASIKRKPWKPNLDDEYYFVDDGDVWSEYWCDSGMDKLYYKVGNCYRTKEQAKNDINKWNAFFESDEVLEV